MNAEIVGEVLVDLVLDEVMAGATLLEFNPNHDAQGHFSAKGADVAYRLGVMAAGRAAGIEAKTKGGDRQAVRAAIKTGMDRQMASLRATQAALNTYGKKVGGPEGTVAVLGPKASLKQAQLKRSYMKQTVNR